MMAAVSEWQQEMVGRLLDGNGRVVVQMPRRYGIREVETRWVEVQRALGQHVHWVGGGRFICTKTPPCEPLDRSES